MIECVRRSSRNVKRWQSGDMALRWTAAGMLEAERQFRRVIVGRAPRVSAERLAELARHVTERDREIALCLYEQQLLATDQLTTPTRSPVTPAQGATVERAFVLLPDQGALR